MRNLLGIILALWMLIGVSACQPVDGPAVGLVEGADSGTTVAAGAGNFPTLIGTWRVTLNQSGGIIGMSRSIDVAGDGSVNVTDLRSGKTWQSRLTTERLQELEKMVTAASYTQVRATAGCADCFIFYLTVTSDTGQFEVELNQIDLANSGLQPVIDFLLEEMGKAGK